MKATRVPPGQSGRHVDPKDVRAISIMNLQSWSDHALNSVHAAATVIGLIAAAVVLICLCLMYLSATELTRRIKPKSEALKTNPPVMFARENHSNGEGTERPSQEDSSSRIGQLETELAAVRREDVARNSRLSQLQGKLTDVQHSEEAKASRVSQLEGELGRTRQSEQQKTSRLSELESELKTTRRLADQAQAQARRFESEQGPRIIKPEQRAQFLEAVRGLATGKILVSAFFENKETHEFGADLLTLLKEAGFDAVERAPVNFFTTSRPSGGIRIGCQDIAHAPAHFATVRKGFEAIGLNVPNTSIVNAEEDDVVEIQITPKQ